MDALHLRDRLERASDVMYRTLEVVFIAVAVIALTCAGLLMVLGTYGVLHDGNDFDFGGGGGGDIVPAATWFL